MNSFTWCAALSTFALGAALTSSSAQEPRATANVYRPAEAGWLEREVYRSPVDAKLSVKFVDVLVGTGRATVVKAFPTGALLDVQAGAAIVTVDRKQQRIAPGVVIRIDQGQMLSIDNRKGERPFVARLIRIDSRR